MRRSLRLVAWLALATGVAGCNAGGSPFRNPFGARQASVQPLPAEPAPVVSAGRPQIAINASPRRVQDAIIDRAQTRGTKVVGANTTGVTLEAPLRQSTEVVQEQCGPHRDDRTVRVYLETLAANPGTLVSERRFIVDGGATACELALPPGDVDEANRSLADLKALAEQPRVATRAPRPDDPAIAGSGPPPLRR